MQSCIVPVGMALGYIPALPCPFLHVARRTHIKLWLQHAWHYKCGKQTNKQTLLTFSNDLIDSNLVPPDGEGSADDISACMTRPRAGSSSRTRPRAHQLPTRVEELPHVGELTGVFAASIARIKCLIPVHWVIALIYNAGQIVQLDLKMSTLRSSLTCSLKTCSDAFVTYNVETTQIFSGKFPSWWSLERSRLAAM